MINRHGHNILELHNVSPQLRFTTSKKKLNIYMKISSEIFSTSKLIFELPPKKPMNVNERGFNQRQLFQPALIDALR